MSPTSLIPAAVENSADPAMHPYLVGALALAVLLVLLFGLMMFGKGRDHS